MLIGFLSDAHLWSYAAHGGPREGGINLRGRLCLATLRRALEALVEDLGAEVVFVLGDLYDGPRPEHALVAATADVFQAYRLPYGVHFLAGNHDQSSYDAGDTALAMFRHLPMMHVWDRPGVWGPAVTGTRGTAWRVVLAPYRPEPPAAWLPELLAKHPGPKVLFGHFGLKHGRTPPELARSPQSVDVVELFEVCAAHDVRVAAVGHWHEAYWHTSGPDGATTLVQCGTLIPSGWRDPGLSTGYGGAYVLDTDTWEFRRATVPGPRFCVVRSAAELGRLVADRDALAGTSLYVRWLAAPGENLGACRDTLGVLQDGGVLAGHEVVPDAKAHEAKTRDAAERAAHAGTTEAAIREYIGAMPLDADILPGEVEAVVNTHLEEP